MSVYHSKLPKSIQSVIFVSLAFSRGPGTLQARNNLTKSPTVWILRSRSVHIESLRWTNLLFTYCFPFSHKWGHLNLAPFFSSFSSSSGQKPASTRKDPDTEQPELDGRWMNECTSYRALYSSPHPFQNRAGLFHGLESLKIFATRTGLWKVIQLF